MKPAIAETTISAIESGFAQSDNHQQNSKWSEISIESNSVRAIKPTFSNADRNATLDFEPLPSGSIASRLFDAAPRGESVAIPKEGLSHENTATRNDTQKIAHALETLATAELPTRQRQERFAGNVRNLLQRQEAGEVTTEQVLSTLKAADSLLTARDGFVDKTSRQLAAEGIIQHAGDPLPMGQGDHGTCPVAAAAHKMFVIGPGTASEMVASAALTGKWQGPDGQVITVDRESLIPGPEEKVFPPANGDRSYASQVFQVLALNEIGQHLSEPRRFLQRGAGELPHGALQLPDGKQQSLAEGASEHSLTGEYWVLPDGTLATLSKPWTSESKVTGLPSWLTVGFITRLTGEENCMIRAGQYKYSHEGVVPHGEIPSSEKNLPKVADDDMLYVNSLEQLTSKLASMEAKHSLPILVSVVAEDGGLYLFDRSTKPNHIVSIDGFRPAKPSTQSQPPEGPQILIHNQWSDEDNGWIDLTKFYSKDSQIGTVAKSA